MFDMLNKAIQSTIETGIGQSILAFGVWGYVLILLVVTLYYAFLCLFKLIFKKKSR
jgi:hypothetical protein